MPTRFYFDDTTASPLNSLAFDASWEQTGQAERRLATRKQVSTGPTALTTKTVTVPVTTTQQILARQYCSDPLPWRTRFSSGVLRLVISVAENANTNNCFLAYVLRVVSNDGTVVRGTLGTSMTNFGTEFNAGVNFFTRIFGNLVMTGGSALTAEPGDRLILELGAHAQAPTAAGSASFRFGAIIGDDFALTHNLSTDLNPWWEIVPDPWSPVTNNWQTIRGNTGIAVTEHGFRR